MDNSSGCYITKCIKCGKIIEQCRCMSPNKATTYTLCEFCKGSGDTPMDKTEVHGYVCPRCNGTGRIK